MAFPGRSSNGSGSGRDQSRGRGSGSFIGARSRLSLPSPPKPLGPLLDSINTKTLLIEGDSPKIVDVEYVASYNWLDQKSPTILIPGSPPAWTPPATDQKLKPDSESVFRDINAARFASYPLEPAVRSVRNMQPDLDLQSVDVVGCGSTIGNLLRFATSQSKPFRFDLDMIGETVFFVRKERSPTELITDLRGHGHTFPEAYTTWDAAVRGSCSHQRIVRYTFQELNLLVRTETDGYVKHDDAKKPASASKFTNQSFAEDVLSTMAVASSEPSQDQKLQMRAAGTRVAQDQIFDIKTRASFKVFDMNEILPRLWLNQTSKFLLAYHQYGVFDKPKVKDVTQEVLRWEEANGTLLAKFHSLLKRILDVVRDSAKPQCEVSWDGEGPLRVTEQIGDGRRALPADLLQLWEA